jgi:hypothetical protein
MLLQCCLFAGIWTADRLAYLQHGRGLHDLLNTRRVVHTGQLHQDLVLAQSVLLNDRLAHSQLIDAVAYGFYRLRDRLVFQSRQCLRLHDHCPSVLGAGSQIVFRQPIVHDGSQVRT